MAAVHLLVVGFLLRFYSLKIEGLSFGLFGFYLLAKFLLIFLFFVLYLGLTMRCMRSLMLETWNVQEMCIGMLDLCQTVVIICLKIFVDFGYWCC